MDQAVDIILELHKGAKTRQLGNFALHEIADLVLLVDLFPWIVAELFNAKADSLIRLIDVDDFRLDFVAFLKDLARMINLTRPTEVRDVNHSVDAFFQLNEGSVSGHVADLAFDAAANGEFLLNL